MIFFIPVVACFFPRLPKELEHSQTYNENELLKLASNGDRTAFASLYSSHVDDLYHCIFLFTRSKDEAKEILQEVFLKMWEHKEGLAEIRSFRNYVYKAARSRLIDKIRHTQVKHRVLAEINRSRETEKESTQDEVDYKSYYRIAQKAIEQLPRKRKLIFQLKTENGLSLDEIAERLHISKNVVKKQLYEAIDFVRHYLLQQGELCILLFMTFLYTGW